MTIQPNKQAINKSQRQRQIFASVLAISALTLTGCQTTQQIDASTSNNQLSIQGSSQYPQLLQNFNIRGKIGITTPETETQKAQSASAFYVWAQEDNRFAMDLTGAMGIGHTVIEYNGVTATLVSQRTGEISANSPEELLLQATGWQAPISQLRYWISGRPAPSDNNSQLDAQGRLTSSANSGWLASFSYAGDSEQNKIPSKIKVTREDGHKVIMTINHH